MQVSELFIPERVSVGCHLSDKAHALREVAELLAGDGPDHAAIVEALTTRERLASTGVGSGVAIPHGRVEGVDGVRVAVVTCPEGVDFAAVDGEPVHILIGILAPQRHPTEHLKVLARVSRLLRQDDTRDRLRRAETPAELVRVLAEAAC